MRKIIPRQNLLSITIWSLFVLLVAILACRKNDLKLNNNLESDYITSRFFQQYPTADPFVISLNGYLKRKNEFLHFTEKTVQKIGFPRWNKAITITSTKTAQRDTITGNSSNVTFIPFVRE